MTIRDDIRQYVWDSAENHQVKDVRIGLGYTAVQLENEQVGLAYTPHRDMKGDCSLFSNFMPQKDVSADVLLEKITSDNTIETALGLATANAIVSADLNNFSTGDVLEITQLDELDCVGMVGNFAPLVSSIRKKAGKLIIFEQIDQRKDDLIPSAEIEKQLPECSVALITATSIINHSFDRIMASAGNCRKVIILGASTPMIPEIFSKTPVTCLSGTIVTDADEILRIVSFGGGMRMFKHCIKKVNVKI